MKKIKHWQGYGTVGVEKVKDSTCTLHIRVVGNHEYGIHRDDIYDLYNWLVKRYDKSIPDATTWYRMCPQVEIIDGYENGVETCDYKFTYERQV